MAKRVRGSTSRPGQRRPLQRTSARPATKPVSPATGAVASPPDSLTEAEEARAAELEAVIVAEERAAEEETARRTRAARSAETAPARAGSNLAASATEEYSYVARDVKRIAIVGGSLVGVLLAIWLIGHLTGLGL